MNAGIVLYMLARLTQSSLGIEQTILNVINNICA